MGDRLWDAKTGDVLAEVKHDDGANGVVFGQEDSHVLRSSGDGSVRLSDISTDYEWPRDAIVLRVEVRTGPGLDLNPGKLYVLP